MAALLLCLPRSADAASPGNASHWISDPNTHCTLFDANIRPGDAVNWIGECRNGRANGIGTVSFFNKGTEFECFTGNFADGVAQDGPVIVRWGKGWSYEGEMASGRFEGQGILITDKKDHFEGTWKNSKLNGPGSVIRASGERYEGEWKDGEPNGRGILTRADGSRQQGQFVEGKFTRAGAAVQLAPTPVSLDAKAAATMEPFHAPVPVRDSVVHTIDAMTAAHSDLASNQKDRQ